MAIAVPRGTPATVRPLGVGLVYWQALEPLFAAQDARLQVLELEPQTLWECRHGAAGWHYQVNQALLQRVAALPQAKLMHGVAQPLGGSCDDPLDWQTPWRQCCEALAPAWVSEHLSFNRFADDGDAGLPWQPGGPGVAQTSFLLPPRQTMAGVAVARRNIERLQRTSQGRSVAFETGVNYLQPRPDELPDGDFFAALAQQADCHILLDLHNLWVNERNGRQCIDAVLAALPLDRVCELHLAGGAQLDGYWLDAHDRLADPALIERAAELIPRLPNLGAIVFEVLPAYIEGLGLEAIAHQLDTLQALWRLRPALTLRPAAACEAGLPCPALLTPQALADVQAWEHSLGRIALGRPPGPAGQPALADDPGTAIFQHLVHEFRCSRIARVLRYTVLALLRHWGAPATAALMAAYTRQSPSDLYTAVEADHFARYLREHLARDPGGAPWLAEVLAFEHAMLRASICGESTQLRWSVDPGRLFDALESGEGLDQLPAVALTMAVEGHPD